jgi:hypothetical protein
MPEDLTTKKAILEALDDMYWQYCAEDGHMFMSAGEYAIEVLLANGIYKGRKVHDDGSVDNTECDTRPDCRCHE